MNANASKNLPILVTGAAGFIGARFVESCNRKGIPVISVDRRSYFTERKENVALDFGTIVDRDELFAWLGTNQPRLRGIMHLGACANTMEMDVAFLNRVNVEYSQWLWNFATREGLPYVYASSAATYGDGAYGYDDDETLMAKLQPLNPYGESKRLFDLWALSEEKKGVHPPAWSGFKFFNVYGFGERHKGKMASVVLHAYGEIGSSGRVKLFKSHKEGIADGHQKRDFIAVEDVISVLHFALDKPIARGIFNLGTGQAQTFLDLVHAVFKALGKPEAVDFIPTPIEIRDKYQYFTEAKMERLRRAGYTAPFAKLEQGVANYVRRLGTRDQKKA